MGQVSGIFSSTEEPDETDSTQKPAADDYHTNSSEPIDDTPQLKAKTVTYELHIVVDTSRVDESTKRDQNRPREDSRGCYRCGSMNHFIRNCPARWNHGRSDPYTNFNQNNFTNQSSTLAIEGGEDQSQSSAPAFPRGREFRRYGTRSRARMRGYYRR